ncbi:MAG: SDR family oxidoreductase [Gammaproteobacteria bacterium]|jgi:NAD(P)-dependent dehydrogenase (short-subunit alcohol dehydrogenase family)|nr:SDR family oxidoreductase [Gammaproteobacteria bacterium]
MSQALQGRVYAVTGGSRGFGLAIARELVAQGARVGLLGRSQQSLDKAVDALGREQALGISADVADHAAVVQAMQAIHAHFGQLNGLVNNAGMARPGRVEELLADEVMAQVSTNFLGTVYCCQAAIPLLRGGDNPRIVNVSSASAWHYDEMVHLSIYASTKAAVERFSRDLRVELQGDRIGVSCIRPGGALTDFSQDWDAEKFAAALQQWKSVGTHMDMGMDVTQVAQAVCYALAQPPGVAVDLLEIRPNVATPKTLFDPPDTH